MDDTLPPCWEWLLFAQPSDLDTCLFWKHTQTHPEIMYWLSGHPFAQSSWCLTWTITKAEWEGWLEWWSKMMLEPVFEDMITLGHLVPAECPWPLKYWTWFIWSEKACHRKLLISVCEAKFIVWIWDSCCEITCCIAYIKFLAPTGCSTKVLRFPWICPVYCYP